MSARPHNASGLLALLLALFLYPGCREHRSEPPAPTASPATQQDAAVAAGDAVQLSLAPVRSAVRRTVEALAQALRQLRGQWQRELASACRVTGWNRLRTVGYRERSWGLRRRSGGRRARRLVLTFDDGPMVKKTPRILDLLKRYRVKATFFVVGRVIHAGSYRLIRRILKEGHALANHSYHHWVKMHTHDQAAEVIEAELLLTQAVVDLALLAKSWRDFRKLRTRMLGARKRPRLKRELPSAWSAIRDRWQTILAERSPTGDSPHRMVFVRPPGGAPFSTRWRRHHRQTYALVLRRLGLINVMWDEDSGDSDSMLTAAERRDAKRIVEAMVEGTRKGGVFLMHDRIGLAGLERSLATITQRRRVVVTDLPSAAQAWYGCAPRVLSTVLQTLQATGYREPASAKSLAPKRKRPSARRRRRRRMRPRKRRARPRPRRRAMRPARPATLRRVSPPRRRPSMR